jgi:tRNA (guanine37-N1)-methyltransferase
MALKELLREKLTKAEMKLVPTSFDVLGSKDKAVAIIELDSRIVKRAKIIANALMRHHKNVKSVLLKASPRTGILRTREYKLIAGDKNTEVIHIENGCRFLLDPTKAYFSSREGTERMRIVSRVKENEHVLVLFAGVGPFAIEIARKAKPLKVVGIEINPIAADYFRKNIRLNKLANAEAVEGNVLEHAHSYHGFADRVLMPLPEKSIEYLEEAIKCTALGGVVHFYCFAKENEISKVKRKISAVALSIGRNAKFLEVQKVLPYGPGIWKYRIDFSV